MNTVRFVPSTQYTIYEPKNQAKLQLPKTESRALVNYY